MQRNTRTQTRALVLYRIQQRVIALLVLFAVVLVMLYTYFVGTAVVHAVVRKEVQQDIAEVNSRIAELEVSYLQQKNSVTHELAAEMGFSSVAQKDYVERARYLGRVDTQ